MFVGHAGSRISFLDCSANAKLSDCRRKHKVHELPTLVAKVANLSCEIRRTRDVLSLIGLGAALESETMNGVRVFRFMAAATRRERTALSAE